MKANACSNHGLADRNGRRLRSPAEKPEDHGLPNHAPHAEHAQETCRRALALIRRYCPRTLAKGQSIEPNEQAVHKTIDPRTRRLVKEASGTSSQGTSVERTSTPSCGTPSAPGTRNVPYIKGHKHQTTAKPTSKNTSIAQDSERSAYKNRHTETRDTQEAQTHDEGVNLTKKSAL